MSSNQTNKPLWPLSINIPNLGRDSETSVINIQAGITTLVGPNGSGKTRALRMIKEALEHTGLIATHNRKLRFLAAGRSTPLEHFRASVLGPGHRSNDIAAVGNIVFRDLWWQIESITGDLLVLDRRADLKLKVEARLQQLLDRSIKLSWTQSGLSIMIDSITRGLSYAANDEASGILQIVALLTAIHNEEIGALLIDEPEISLHPQHQQFLLEEMESVAGDPADPKRKLIVIATHSPSILPIRTIQDLPRLVFFNVDRRVAAQVPSDAAILNSNKLISMLARLSSTHRIAIFAERLLLVEGSTDEIIASQIARQLGMGLLAGNSQILPTTGKGESRETAKLFTLMNKEIAIIADLDALSDDNSLVNFFSSLPGATHAANTFGHESIARLDRELRNALESFMTTHSESVDAAAITYRNWSSSSNVNTKRRVTLARLLTEPESFGEVASVDASALRMRYNVLLEALGALGCFFLRRGAIENYYENRSEYSKPDQAADEAASILSRPLEETERQYEDVIRALRHIARRQPVDEDQLLRPKLSAMLAAAFQTMTHNTPDKQLNAVAKATIGADADIFRLENCSNSELRIRVHLVSPLFERQRFPFEVAKDENLNLIVPQRLPGVSPG